jgi:hypothetical protein
MANEVRYTTSYTFSNGGAGTTLSNTFSYSVTGSGRNFEATITLNTGQNRALSFGDLANVSHLSMKNLNTLSGTVAVATNPGQISGLSVLPPLGSISLLPISTGIWVSGQGANVTLAYTANEA